MKNWEKRRMKRAAEIAHIAEDQPPNTYSDFSMGWDEGRTDALSELSFVREALDKINQTISYGTTTEQTNIIIMACHEALEKLDALIKNN